MLRLLWDELVSTAELPGEVGCSHRTRYAPSAAWAASHKKDSYFQVHAGNLMQRRGRKRGLVAVAHSLLIVVYHMLKEETHYCDWGPRFLDRLRAKHLIRFHVRRLQPLGLQAALRPVAT